MSPIFCISDFEIQCKHLKKFRSNRATKKKRRRKSEVFFFCMFGTEALSVHHPDFLRPKSYSSAASVNFE